MKKILFSSLFLLFLATSGEAQVVIDGTNINDMDISYCELRGRTKFMSTKMVVNVDFGQKFKWFKEQSIMKKGGGKMAFNSMIDALNFMEKNGWAYVNNYSVSDKDGNNTYHYLLKKTN